MRLPDLRVGVFGRPMPEQENRLTLNGACIPSAKWPKKFLIGPLLASAEGGGVFHPYRVYARKTPPPRRNDRIWNALRSLSRTF